MTVLGSFFIVHINFAFIHFESPFFSLNSYGLNACLDDSKLLFFFFQYWAKFRYFKWKRLAHKLYSKYHTNNWILRRRWIYAISHVTQIAETERSLNKLLCYKPMISKMIIILKKIYKKKCLCLWFQNWHLVNTHFECCQILANGNY